MVVLTLGRAEAVSVAAVVVRVHQVEIGDRDGDRDLVPRGEAVAGVTVTLVMDGIGAAASGERVGRTAEVDRIASALHRF